MTLHIAYPWLFLSLITILLICALLRKYFYKYPEYCYPLTAVTPQQRHRTNISATAILNGTRFVTLCILALATARLQFVDHRQTITSQGIDIMLVLDVSGSMDLFDDLNDQRTRLDIARQEAIKFIDRRIDDAVGLVIFGALAASHCPLTTDKTLLKDIINQTGIGALNPDGTALSTAIAMAANRLRNSTAKSKIMIVLTDGAPSPHDSPPQIALDLAQKFGIKIYTIGIGSEAGGYMNHPLYGVMALATPLNKELLEQFAKQTGGNYFEARKAHDVEHIYSIIDALEKSDQKPPTYTHGIDCIVPLLWLILGLLTFSTLMTTTRWFNLWH